MPDADRRKSWTRSSAAADDLRIDLVRGVEFALPREMVQNPLATGRTEVVGKIRIVREAPHGGGEVGDGFVVGTGLDGQCASRVDDFRDALVLETDHGRPAGKRLECDIAARVTDAREDEGKGIGCFLPELLLGGPTRKTDGGPGSKGSRQAFPPPFQVPASDHFQNGRIRGIAKRPDKRANGDIAGFSPLERTGPDETPSATSRLHDDFPTFQTGGNGRFQECQGTIAVSGQQTADGPGREDERIRVPPGEKKERIEEPEPAEDASNRFADAGTRGETPPGRLTCRRAVRERLSPCGATRRQEWRTC